MPLPFLISAVLILAAVSWGISKTRHPFLTAFKSAVTGISGLLLVNLTSAFTGCYIAVNACTAFVATVLSLPGVCALLVMKLIFNY